MTRVVLALILFVLTAVPLFSPKFSIPGVGDFEVDVNSYVVLFACVWIAWFAFDSARVWWKAKPRKIGLKGFEGIELIPYGRVVDTGHSLVVFLPTSTTPFWYIVGPPLIPLAFLYVLHNVGWIVESTMVRISLEIVCAWFAFLYRFLGRNPTRIEFTQGSVTVDGKRLHQDAVERFIAGRRLSYVYGGRTEPFGGYWTEAAANDVARALTGLLNLAKKRARSGDKGGSGSDSSTW